MPTMYDEDTNLTFSVFFQIFRGCLISMVVKHEPNNTSSSIRLSVINSLVIIDGKSVAFQIEGREIKVADLLNRAGTNAPHLALTYVGCLTR